MHAPTTLQNIAKTLTFTEQQKSDSLTLTCLQLDSHFCLGESSFYKLSLLSNEKFIGLVGSLIGFSFLTICFSSHEERKRTRA